MGDIPSGQLSAVVFSLRLTGTERWHPQSDDPARISGLGSHPRPDSLAGRADRNRRTSDEAAAESDSEIPCRRLDILIGILCIRAASHRPAVGPSRASGAAACHWQDACRWVTRRRGGVAATKLRRPPGPPAILVDHDAESFRVNLQVEPDPSLAAGPKPGT